MGVGIAAAMYAHLAGAARVILVGGPANRLDLAREIGVGDVHIDIFEFPDAAERVRLVLDATPGRRGADVVLECAGVPEAVAEGWEMARRGGSFLALGQYTDRGPTPLNPHVITRGMVFLGKNVEIHATPEFGHLEIGRWVHIGDKNTIRCHEGSLRFGDKVVLGRDNVINTYLDIELGDSALMADWVYVCDFDHKMDDINTPIKDQGIAKSPVRIGPDTWIATKVTILRGTTIGRGCVLGSHAVVKGDIPDYSIAVGAPAKVVKNRRVAWEASAAQRAELAAALADIERKKAMR